MVSTQPVVIAAGPYNSFKARKTWTVSPARVLNTFEISMFTADGGTAYMNGHACPIKKGWVLLGRPGDVRWNELHFQCLSVHFSVDEPGLLQMLDTIPQFFKPDSPQQALSLFRLVWEAFRSEDRFSAIASGTRLCELLWQMHLCTGNEDMSVRRNPVRKAVRLIQERYDERITVEQMAECCDLSTSHFHKMFVENMGTTPNRYLVLTRLASARALLLAGNQSVAQIAECCGFSSQAYFCQCLKKVTGLSPRQFVRQSGQLNEG